VGYGFGAQFCVAEVFSEGGKCGFLEAVRSSAAQGVEGCGVDMFPGICAAHLEHDAARAEAYDGADLEQLETDGIDLSLSPFGSLQGQASQGLDQRIGSAEK
jgi:hypothetical protein